MDKKMTRKDALTYVLTNGEWPEDVAATLEAMVEQLSKPHASKKKVTTSDKLLEVYRDSILSLLTEGSKLASDIRKGIPELAEVSPQSITAMLNKLTAEGAVVREKGKKGMEYSLA